MIVEKDIDLYKYSTMRTHSIGAVMYTPENIDELKELVFKLQGNCYYLGGGSNVVFASRVERPIVNLMALNKNLNVNSDGTITAGCSVRIQKLINFGMEQGRGGFEYLYSLPASVGGIVFMNAGRGKVHNQQISDWIESIDYIDFDDLTIKKMHIEPDKWSYRYSPFQKMNAVIYSVTFKMNSYPKEQIESRIQERIDSVKINQEGNKPSCGSVMHTCNKYIMFLFKGYRKGGAHYSKKVNNWISNDNNATGDDVIALIEKPLKVHRLLGLACIPEIRIYK